MSTIFAEPRDIKSLDECMYYHTIDLPNYGVQNGMWNLQPNINKYLGRVDFDGKKVLEMGTASGYLCFHMEKQGADVIAFDLNPDEISDIVPYARADYDERAQEMTPWLEKMRNGYWLAHKSLNSSAKVVYGNAYNVPDEIGYVDISTFGMILLHLRDPFKALQSALRLTKETVIITEPIWHWYNFIRFFAPSKQMASYAMFVPDGQLAQPTTTWWHLSPTLVRRFIGVLGFEKSKIIYHMQRQEEENRNVICYTVVGERTVPLKGV